MTWPEFVQWSNEHNGVIAIIALVVSTFVGVLALLPSRVDARVDEYWKQIDDPASWPGLIGEMRSGRSAAYFRAISRVLGFAERWWGPALSWRAFDRCIAIAFLYPLFAAILGWAVANTHSPGGLDLFRDEPDFLLRILRSGALLAALGIAVWIAGNAERFSKFVVDRLLGGLDSRTARAGYLSKAARAVMEHNLAWFDAQFAFNSRINVHSSRSVSGVRWERQPL